MGASKFKILINLKFIIMEIIATVVKSAFIIGTIIVLAAMLIIEFKGEK